MTRETSVGMIRRALGPGDYRAEVREIDGEPRNVLTGYAVVFNQRSLDLGGFVETILPGAFRETLRDGHDVKMLWMHDATRPLARTANGTLRLEERETGLWFEAVMPQTTLGRDAHADVTTRLVDSMSFGFDYGERTWKENDTLLEVVSLHLWEISPVTWPAYPAATVEARGVYVLELPEGAPAEAQQRALRTARAALPGAQVICMDDGVRLYRVDGPSAVEPPAPTRDTVRGVEALIARELELETHLIAIGV